MLAQDRESARRKGSAQPVGDGVARLEGFERSGSERAVGVVGAGRLTANDSNVLSNAFCAEAGSAEQSATADGSEHSVEVWYFFEKLFGGCGLAGDDAVVVIRMNQIGASLLLHTVTDFLARGNLGLTKGDFAAVDLDSLDFHSRRVFRHDDISGHAAPGCGTGHRRTVIAARLRNDAAGGLLRGKRQNGVGGATNLEGAGLLQVLAFEEETGSGQCVE